VHYTQHDEIIKFKEEMNESIFACMEMSGQSYIEVMAMPVKRFSDYLKWKSRLEEERQKKIEEENKQMSKKFKFKGLK
jgi:hypothetical protein